MVSNLQLVLLILTSVAIAVFVVTMWRRGNVLLIHRIYFSIASIVFIWTLALIVLYFVPKDDLDTQYFIDSITNIGAFLAPLGLLISLTFTREWNRLPRWSYFLLALPLITFLMVWTNPLHHFYYKMFSLNNDKVIFGWYFYVHGFYSYLCIVLSAVFILRFAVRNRSTLYTAQAVLFAVGSLFPLVANLLAVGKIIPMTIVTTLFAHVVGVVGCHGAAIFFFHMLDIKPIAVQTVLNRIPDCYLVISTKGLVVSYNQAFAEVFAKEYGIRENTLLNDCLNCGNTESNAGLYTLLAAIESCRASNTTISYEHSILHQVNEELVKRYYMVDITQLISEGRSVGFVIFFKEVTKLKESMERLQNSQTRLMEQERLASLGQMVGGIAHNLKTPIMSISGSVTSIDHLIDESETSLGDDEVTFDDYREIYGEMRNWTSRVREACAYMSDIITAVKGQAANLGTVDNSVFTMDDVLKRVTLLLRHEFVLNHCVLRIVNNVGEITLTQGDINSLVQVINNLAGNAIDALKPLGGGPITIALDLDDANFRILIKDRGIGVAEDVKEKLFRHMVTNKGAMGSGLGVFISNSIIKAKFDGRMWFEDNPGGGSIFGIAIPRSGINIKTSEGGETR